MTIADEKIKQSIRRDTLIKITVMMDATDHVVSIGGNDYTVSIPIGASYEPVAAYQNGAQITTSWNSTTNVLTLTKTQTIGDDYPVTVKFFVYLTTGQTKYLDQDDPAGAISNVAEWEPRLQANLTYKEYVRDIFAGNFPFATGSNFNVINLDNKLDDFFTRFEDYICPYYFYLNEVKIWQGLNDEFEFVGTFYIESMNTKNKNILSFNIKPEAKKLMTSATFGDDSDETIATIDNYPNIDPSQDGSIIPLIYSCGNSMETVPTVADGLPKAVLRSDTSAFRCINIDYAYNTPSGGINPSIICGRSVDALPTDPVVVAVTNGGTTNTVTTTGASSSVVLRKATIASSKYYHSFSSNMYVRVNWSDASWTSSLLYYMDYSSHEVWVDNTNPALSITSITRMGALAVWYQDSSGEDLTPLSTVSVVSNITSNGHYLIEGYLSAGFNSSYKYYSIFFTDVETRGPENLAYDILTAAGLPHNFSDTSIKANKVFYQIPRPKENEYKTYAEYLPEIIRPMTMSMLRLDYSTGYYEFVEMPSTIDSSNYPATFHDITDTDILDNSLSFNKRYNDIITDLFVTNKDVICRDTRAESSKTYTNIRERNVYGLDKTSTINHAGFLPNTAPYNLDAVNDMLRTPTVRYSFAVSLKFFDVKVLDVVKLTSKEVVNNINDGTEFVYLVVTSVEKGKSSINIEAQQVTYL